MHLYVRIVTHSNTSSFLIRITLYESATINKILEANSSLYVKQRTTGKVQFLFFSNFLLILTKCSFWEEDWALGYNSMKFEDLLDIF